MNFKIDTREKFTVITPDSDFLADNLAAPLFASIEDVKQSDTKNIILNLKNINAIETDTAQKIAQHQQSFYEENISFVVCEMQSSVEDVFEKAELMDTLNYTPTESEAWDIIQMEEIERELMDDENPLFNSLDND